MCGIAGIFSFKDNLEKGISVLKDMQKMLDRRGPDDNGLEIFDVGALVHTRLSVVDLENGKQPMKLEFRGYNYTIVYNGELYNTAELRSELESLGHKFLSRSDTEVLLHSFAEWKEECVKKLNGIFAFAIYERVERRLFFARDRIGVKPFFYALKGDKFIFASELKALLVHPEIETEINSRGIAELILVGPGRTPGYGVFLGIDELKPAYFGYYGVNGISLTNYWRLKDRIHSDSLEETIFNVKRLVTDSIERQLISDVPVGTFLSGGLDSSLISSIASRYFGGKGQRLQTFSVEFKDNDKFFSSNKFQPTSDGEYIEYMQEYLGAESHRIVIDTSELSEALYLAVDARDLPGMADVDSSLLLFCKEIKKFVTVALSGECADEIFGGYPWYRDKEIREKDGFPWAQSTEYRARFLRPEMSSKINATEYIRDLYKNTVAETDILFEADADERRLREMVNLNLTWFMQTLLDRKDRMSMYNGLEVRVPYCDYRIAEYLYSVPWEMKDLNGNEKGLLRESMKEYLPSKVLYRKKSPYPKTHNPAYLKEVSKRLREEVLSDKNSPLLQIVNDDELENLLKANNPTPWYGQLMNTPQTIAYFLQFNYWLKKYKVKITGI